LQSTSFSIGLIVPSLSGQSKPLAGQNQHIFPRNCLFRKIQRSPRPGLKQKASQNPGEPNFRRNYQTVFRVILPTGQETIATHGKVNCMTPKVNTFFGSLLITLFQK
jgi:hypothetical protein